MVLVGLVLVGLVGVAWRIVADTAGYNAAASDPETALAWMPSEAMALDELAYREFTKSGGDLDAARGLAERALRSNPLDARALLVLGLIAERQGAQARADLLVDLSGERTWRDVTTQAWLLKRDIQRGKFEQVLSHIDALLRVNPEILEQTFPLLSAFTIDKRTFDALASFLAAAPPWRADFLAKLSARLPDTGRLVQLYAALKDSQHPPDAMELGPYLDRLIKDGRFAQAYQSWRETLPPQQRTSEVYPYNGDFAAPIDGLPFNWLLRPGPGMNVQIVALPGKAESRALQFQFSGTRVAPFTVGQLMLLAPGEYRMTGRVRAEELRTQRGLGWHIFCAEPPNNTLALTNLVANAVPWTSFSVDFTVPAANCRGQWLNLEIPSRTASERQIEGQIWYENLQIGRVANGHSPAVQ
jgi:tetratricopeptide (TPR) repeat protein